MGVFFTGDRHNLELSQKDAERILSTLQEYLGCFRLYGIDMNGNELLLTTEGSGMEARALSHFVSEVEFGGPSFIDDMESLIEEVPLDDDDDDDREEWKDG